MGFSMVPSKHSFSRKHFISRNDSQNTLLNIDNKLLSDDELEDVSQRLQYFSIWVILNKICIQSKNVSRRMFPRVTTAMPKLCGRNAYHNLKPTIEQIPILKISLTTSMPGLKKQLFPISTKAPEDWCCFSVLVMFYTQ